MFNPQKVIDLLEKSKIKNKVLLDSITGKHGGSVAQVLSGDIRVSKLEKIADFFGVPTDTFFDRDINVTKPDGRESESIVRLKERIAALETLLEEKDKRLRIQEQMISMLRDTSQNP